MNIGKRLKKKAVLAGNCNGFIGNRMLEGYAREAFFMLEEGCTPAQVDAPLRAFGMPMGPFEMSDLAGNDIGYFSRQNFPRPTERYAGAIADRLVENGRLGQKTKAGWYDYGPENNKPKESEAVFDMLQNFWREKSVETRSFQPDQVLDRCLLPLVNEGFKILEEGIAQRESDVDMVYLYGYGFPRYKGGPLFWARHIRPGGLPQVLEDLTRYGAENPSVSHWVPSSFLAAEVAKEAASRARL